ncbi:MAG: hypothetical protein U0531_05495 [Dehalococcoidia bacterium]
MHHEIEHLIVAGAFDDLGLARRELLWQLGLFVEWDGRRRTARRGKEGAPAGLLPLPVEGDMLTPRPDDALGRQLVADYYVPGLSPGRRTCSACCGAGWARDCTPAATWSGCRRTPWCRSPMVVRRQRPGTAKGCCSCCWRRAGADERRRPP